MSIKTAASNSNWKLSNKHHWIFLIDKDYLEKTFFYYTIWNLLKNMFLSLSEREKNEPFYI